MVIMLITFVGLRQIYLFVMANYIYNTPLTVGFGYPVGWMACCVTEVVYFYVRYVRNGAHRADSYQSM